MEINNTYTIDLHLEEYATKISPMLYGLFFEDINFAGDGGIYGELIKNRSFEYFDINGVLDKRLMGWEKVETQGSEVELNVLNDQPINKNNINYLRVNVKNLGKKAGIKNLGFNDIGFSIKKGENYNFSMYAKNLNINKAINVTAAIENPNTGEIYGQTALKLSSDKWKQYTAVISSKDTFPNANFVLYFQEIGTVELDMVSLFPQKTFNNRENGLRADMVQMLKEIKPSFLRFPGGCIVEGRSFPNMYRWKETIGDISERKLNWNRWQLAEYQLPNRNSEEYFQSYGLGFYEYFLLCEDIGAEPVPIINAGMTCQWHEGLLIDLEELDEYIQDVLDLIEYANGDESTTWGKKRIEAGHIGTFDLKYIGIGNEQWGENYFERYEKFHKVIKSKYPNIQLITSAGWAPDGKDFDEAQIWMKNTKLKAEIVDEHFYKEPAWFIENINRYDDYDRNLPKVFAGEYAAHSTSVTHERRNNLKTALAEAAFLTGIEKNADHVLMACYAPLFGKTGYNQWQPNLIWFNNSEIFGTPSYYVQQIFSTNTGDRIIKTKVSEEFSSTKIENNEFFCENSKVKSELQVVSNYDENLGEIIIKAVNLSSNPQKAVIKISGVEKISQEGTAIILKSKNLADENSYAEPQKVSPYTKVFSGVSKDFTYEFDEYGVTILRLKTLSKA